MRWWIPALVLAFSAPVFAQDGSGQLSGTETIRVKPHCGNATQIAMWDLSISNGAWTASRSGTSLDGTATPVGSSGKIWDLTFSQASKLAFDQELASWASDACLTGVTISGPSSVTHFNLKLSKRGTLAKLTLFASAPGSTTMGPGTASLKTIKRGAWLTLP